MSVALRLNAAELDALRGLSDLQFRAYVAGLRPYMDYATGLVGARRRISHRSIAEDCFVEPIAGVRQHGAPSRDQVRRALRGLERAGLIRVHSADRQLLVSCRLADTDRSARNQAATRPPQQAAPVSEWKNPDTSDDHEYHTLQAAPARSGQAAPHPVSVSAPAPPARAGEDPPGVALSPDWQPGAPTRTLLADEAIPVEFVEQTLADFRFYWIHGGGAGTRRTPGAWQTAFVAHVRCCWQRAHPVKSKEQTHGTQTRSRTLSAVERTRCARERLRQRVGAGNGSEPGVAEPAGTVGHRAGRGHR